MACAGALAVITTGTTGGGLGSLSTTSSLSRCLASFATSSTSSGITARNVSPSRADISSATCSTCRVAPKLRVSARPYARAASAGSLKSVATRMRLRAIMPSLRFVRPLQSSRSCHVGVLEAAAVFRSFPSSPVFQQWAKEFDDKLCGGHMKAARIHRFGPPDVIRVEELPRPSPATGEVLVRVTAAGVAPWDALIRKGQSKVSGPPPLTLGSDLSGVVEAVGADVTLFKIGDEVYGVTNPQFVGANAEYAIASAAMVALKPKRLTNLEAASIPVVAVTAWQMLFEYARPEPGHTILILAAAGNVGAYAVQFAANGGFQVIAVVGPKDVEYVRTLGARDVVNYRVTNFAEVVRSVDVVIDTVGGDTRERAFGVLKPGGILVTVVSTEFVPARSDVRSAFFYAEVTTARLNAMSRFLESGQVMPQVGSVLPLEDVRTAHEMLAGRPHQRGKIMLHVAT